MPNREKLLEIRSNLIKSLETIDEILKGSTTDYQVQQAARPQQQVQHQPVSHQYSVTARTLGDMVTAKQLNMIKAVARERNRNAEVECSKIFQCSVEELSKRAASELIDHLRR